MFSCLINFIKKINPFKKKTILYNIVFSVYCSFKTIIPSIPYKDNHIYCSNTFNFNKNIISNMNEQVCITFSNPIIIFLALQYRQSFPKLKISYKNDYIHFTRILDSQLDKINCDWCSIINGLVKYIEDEKSNTYFWIYISNLYLMFALILRSNKKYINYIDIFFSDPITFTKLMLEEIELRWCPFKSMTKMYYRNNDERYISPTKENILLAGKYLSQHETIECFKCSKYLNDNIPHSTKKLEDLLDEYYRYLLL